MRTRTMVGTTAAAAVLALTASLMKAEGPAPGQQVFETKCASCHAKDGSGTTAMGKKLNLRDLRSPEVQKQTDQELVNVTTKGKGKMPAYQGKLTEAQISELVSYIRLLAKK